MIMSVCVLCVYIVTTKCRAMRQKYLNKHEDQETISFLYIFLLYYTYPCPATATDDNKKIHLVKYEQKKV